MFLLIVGEGFQSMVFCMKALSLAVDEGKQIGCRITDRTKRLWTQTDELLSDEDGVESEDEESEIGRTIATMNLCLQI